MIHTIHRHLSRVAMLGLAAAALSGCVLDEGDTEETASEQVEQEAEALRQRPATVSPASAATPPNTTFVRNRVRQARDAFDVGSIASPSNVPLGEKRQEGGRPNASDPPPHPW